MKKCVFLFSLVCLCSLTMKAQTIYSYIFADIDDPSIGFGNTKNVENVTNFVDYVSQVSGMEIAGGAPKVFTGEDFSLNKVNNVIENLKCNYQDIIIFYYAGHGGRANEDKSKSPQITFNSTIPEHFMPIEQIWYKIIDKGTHFCLVICDCGNAPSDLFVPKEVSLFNILRLGGNALKTVNVPNDISCAGSLFYEKSYVLATACNEGENAYISLEGGLFTNTFLTQFYEYAKNGNKENANWTEFSHNVKIGDGKQSPMVTVMSPRATLK